MPAPKPPTGSQLAWIVREFRDGILSGEDPESWCFMVSAPLESYLNSIGVTCKLIEGSVPHVGPADTHFWIELPDGTIIDATASQFRRPNGRAMPAVFIGPKPPWYLKGKTPCTTNSTRKCSTGAATKTSDRSKPAHRSTSTTTVPTK